MPVRHPGMSESATNRASQVCNKHVMHTLFHALYVFPAKPFFRAFADTGLHRSQEVGSAELDDAQTTVLRLHVTTSLRPAGLNCHHVGALSATVTAWQGLTGLGPVGTGLSTQPTQPGSALSRGLLHVPDPAVSLTLWINHQRPPATWSEHESARGVGRAL